MLPQDVARDLPFGGVETSTGNPIALRFPGQWFQSESGLHQNWMRDYDPTLGRYIQADPLGVVDGASVYGYALQNSNRYFDPTGECIGPAAGVCIFLGFLLYDILTDEDDCYTLWDYGWFVADFFVPGPRLKPPPGKGGGSGGPPPNYNPNNGPNPNNGNGKPHGGPDHDKAIDDRVADLQNDPTVSNIRKNQQQVDVNGNNVGRNRPDVQYDQGGCHVCVEYDHSPARSQAHGKQISTNDPSAIVELKLLP